MSVSDSICLVTVLRGDRIRKRLVVKSHAVCVFQSVLTTYLKWEISCAESTWDAFLGESYAVNALHSVMPDEGWPGHQNMARKPLLWQETFRVYSLERPPLGNPPRMANLVPDIRIVVMRTDEVCRRL